MSKRLGNAIDPFKTIFSYGPDPTRWYMMFNSNPWENLKFAKEGIEEVKRKFFGTLFNTYNFFALYANIDKFSHKDHKAEEKAFYDGVSNYTKIGIEMHKLFGYDADEIYKNVYESKQKR